MIAVVYDLSKKFRIVQELKNFDYHGDNTAILMTKQKKSIVSASDIYRALERKCNNAEHPDKYGHYREAKYCQIKHHWIWKVQDECN